MSFLEEGRELIQDLVVPGFKALEAELKGVNERLSELKDETKSGFAELKTELKTQSEKADARFDLTIQAIHELSKKVEVLTDRIDVDRKISQFESRLAAVEERHGKG